MSDILTLANWAMLFCWRARESQAKARALRAHILQLQKDNPMTPEIAQITSKAAAEELRCLQLVEKGRRKLERVLHQNDSWIFFCMARLCAGTQCVLSSPITLCLESPPPPPTTTTVGSEPEKCKHWLEKCAPKLFLAKVLLLQSLRVCVCVCEMAPHFIQPCRLSHLRWKTLLPFGTWTGSKRCRRSRSRKTLHSQQADHLTFLRSKNRPDSI